MANTASTKPYISPPPLKIATEVGGGLEAGYNWLSTAIGGGIDRALDIDQPKHPGTHATTTYLKTKVPEATQQAAKKATQKQTGINTTKHWQANYTQDIKSLLEPYQEAVGYLPEQLQNYLTGLKKQPLSAPNAGANMAAQLANQYAGGGITASAAGMNPTLSAAAQNATSTAYSSNQTVAHAYSQLAQDMGAYMQAAPYQGITKALLTRVRENTMYGIGTPISQAQGWPSYLKKLYQGVITGAGLSTTTSGGTNISIPNLGTVGAAAGSNKKTAKSTATQPSTGGGSSAVPG